MFTVRENAVEGVEKYTAYCLKPTDMEGLNEKWKSFAISFILLCGIKMQMFAWKHKNWETENILIIL